MKNLFLLSLFLSGFFGQAQYTAIPDPNFEQALIAKGIDSGTIDGKVLTANVSGITNLEIRSMAISDLTGIQDFLSLTFLDCDNNQLTSLDVTKNTALTDLYCWQNQLTSLDLTKNTALNFLDCGSNQLTNLDVTKNTALINLSCHNNQITSLDVTKNTALIFLACYTNQLTSLNVTKNTALTHLWCWQNQLTSLDVTKNTALTLLWCGENKITSLDVAKNTALTSLQCYTNQISSLDVTKNTALTFLNCWDNQISSLDVTKNTALTGLYCGANQISSLDVTKNTALTNLSCPSNQISSLDLSKNTALFSLFCYTNQINSLDLTKNTALNTLHCYFNQITSLDVTKNIALNYLYCSNNSLTSLNLKNGNNNIIFGYSFESNPNLTCIQVDNKAYSDANWSTYKDAAASFSENCGTTLSNTAPIITATGNQIYCPQTHQKIVTGVSIVDPDDTSTNAIYIQISTGYVNGQDELTLANPLSHPTIATSWDIKTGKLKLYSPTGVPISYIDFIAAIKDVEFNNSSASPSGTRNFSITLGTGLLSYLPSNGHYYEYVASSGINWTKARDEAATKSYYGLQGYLATLTAADEAQLAGAQAPGTGWIGGSDAQTEGVWKWVTGPEAGTTFWNGKQNGTTTAPFNYANWNSPNEPNDFNNNEDYAHITSSAVGSPGTWNDLPEQGNPPGDYYPQGYIVEYGGMPGDPILQISASTTMTMTKITNTAFIYSCDAGSFTLEATSSSGIVNWYDKPTGGTLLHTGNSFTTPNLTTTTTYYVDATNGSCTNARTPITATINTEPTITSITPANRCDSGIVTLGATASAGIINWYNSLTGGFVLGTGTSFTTPILATTTTYYAEAIAFGCITPTRTPVMATVNFPPTITSTLPANRCDSGSVTLEAVASAGTINWYDSPTGGTLLGTGTAFTTPTLSITTTYYVDTTLSGCTTPSRTAIIATINPIPTITSTTPANICDSGSATLRAVASAGTINWHDSLTGGTLLGTGNSFITPSISSTTTYYIDATTAGCTTPTRTPISATIDTTPTITSTTSAKRCDTGTVTLEATASAGTINWYDVPTGGTSLGTGASFTTPSISSTTHYYVDTTNNQCTSPRLPVDATVYPVLKMNEEVILCQTETATLDASISGMSYLWSPNGETTQTIVVSSIGDYSVIISSPLANCDSKKDIKVIEHPKPIIKEIVVDENSVTIQLENPETYYEFSIDGELFKDSNQFSRIPSGQYTAYIREKNLCNLIQQAFTIFTIDKYFTPNNDGHNDLWEIKEMRDYPNSRVEIFNRYGKLLKQLNSGSLGWNGKFNGIDLPADDYWYVLKMEDSKPEIKGHFSLKR